MYMYASIIRYTNAVIYCAVTSIKKWHCRSTEGSTGTYSCISEYSFVGNSHQQYRRNEEWLGTTIL